MTAKTRLAMLAAVAAEAILAAAFTAIEMPESQFADSEVSASVPFDTDGVEYADLTFRFDCTPTNSYDLAFGTDANENGALDAEEVETRCGWRRGVFFAENARTWERFETPDENPGRLLSADIRIDLWPATRRLRRVRVSGANASALQTVLAAIPSGWAWRREWNMVRATRRGAEPPSDRLEFTAAAYGLAISLR